MDKLEFQAVEVIIFVEEDAFPVRTPVVDVVVVA
jgi:hypothetical protein